MEQVVRQVVARTQGALPRAADTYQLAAPIDSFWRPKVRVHFKLDSSTPWLVLGEAP